MMQTVMQKTKNNQSTSVKLAKDLLFDRLDTAIDDMENGKIQTLDEAWEEIDSI